MKVVKAKVMTVSGRCYQEALLGTYKLAKQLDGYICSLPDIWDLKLGVPLSHEIWTDTTEQNSVSERICTTTRGNVPVVLTIHGMGPLTNYLLRGGRINKNPAKYNYGVPLPRDVVLSALEGRVEDGEIPVFPFSEYQKSEEVLPLVHGVIMDKAQALHAPKDYWLTDAFHQFIFYTPRNLVAVGGVLRARRIQERLKGHHYAECPHLDEKDFDKNVARQLMFNSDFDPDIGISSRKLMNDATWNNFKKKYYILYPDNKDSEGEIAKLSMLGVSYSTAN